MDSQASSQASDSRPATQLRVENRLTTASIDEASKFKAMIKYLHGRLIASQWLPNDVEYDYRGVLLRKSRGIYISEPGDIHPMLLGAVQKINAEVAFTMATETTKVLFSLLQSHQRELILPNGSHLQVIDSIVDIATSPASFVKKYQYAALVREERILLVWHDELDKILLHAADLEGRLLSLVWGTSSSLFPTNTPYRSSQLSFVTTPSESLVHVPLDAKLEPTEFITEVAPISDEEAAKRVDSLDRPVALTSSIFVGLGVFLIIVLLLGFNTSNLLFECLVDGTWLRMAFMAIVPFFMLLSSFFFFVVFGNLFQALGPIKTVKLNSRFHSPIKPNLSCIYSQGFSPPRITIQMPVYTESLEGVIMPTIASLKAAISHYESHGGTANIFVNDDGLAYLNEEKALERMNFYHDNNISWVARPKNNDESGYIRKGKFKKASNMNFALNVANRVEDELLSLLQETLEKTDMIDAIEEEALYCRALDRILETDARVRASGDIRIGELILIVDSDTRVPENCLFYGAAEMFLSPEVAILQHSTGVMQVSRDYFENGITFFTNLIYSAIRFAVGSGEVAPFVGHNAFLRWKAVQAVGKDDPDGYVAYWSESHVSEDFDIALRLQIQGNVVRLASYHGDEFKEGVSLTIYDELARWEKYAYGCNELVFNPFFTWLWRGPFSKLFLTFLWSNIHLSSKLTIIGYISSYYALSSGFPLTVLNYFLVGWFNGDIDKFYMQSWKVFLSLLVVFTGMGNVCLAILRYRLGEKGLWAALIENFKWAFLFAVFFGGLSFHLNLALLAHMFSINMQWGTTAKEKDDSNFFKEIPKIFKSFKWMYAFVIPFFGVMIFLGAFAPRGWEVVEVAAIVPLSVMLVSHALLPFILNPSLMVFNY
jgi:hypothetical protein